MTPPRCMGAAWQAHSVFRQMFVALNNRVATALQVNHLSSVVMMVVVTMPAAMRPMMRLTDGAAGTAIDEHESKKGTKLFHP